MSSFAVLLGTAAATAATPIDCSTAVVGGGWAGVYAAWRLAIDSAAVKPADVCLFEARDAVGGRTYSVDVSVPTDDATVPLTIDIGAYRFGKQMHLPADLILNVFNLSVVCYEPDCKPDPEFNTVLYRIVDSDGHNAGYATPVRAMLAQLVAAGVRVFYGHELTGVYDGTAAAGVKWQPLEAVAEGGGATARGSAAPASLLHFAGGAVARASDVLLNLGRPNIERLDPASVLFPPAPRGRTPLATTILRNCTPCQAGGGGVPAESHMDVKVYAVYDDPWWLTKLGLQQGAFVDVSTSPPLVGRYHDGPVHRDGSGKPVGPGALEAVYTFSLMHPQIRWYVPFVRDLAGEPLTITTDSALVEPLHAKLMAFHTAAFAAKGLNASQVPPPKQVVLGVWTTDKLALLPSPTSSNMHAMIKSDRCPEESCLAGVTPTQYNSIISTPNPERRIHLANNDYTYTGFHDVPCCWAEQSLRSVERTLHTAWALPRPSWLDAAYWQQVVSNA